jgi:hypothetical protein
MPDDQATCDLCGYPLPADGSADRCCGLNMCQICYAGDSKKRLAEAGLELEVEKWTTTSGGENKTTDHHTRVTGTARCSIHPRATFTREGLGDRIARFFGREEIEVDDPLFDDSVWVDTDTDADTRKLLSIAGIHDVILEAITDFGGVRFTPTEGGCTIVVHSTWNKNSVMPDVFSHKRVVAAGLHYLQEHFPVDRGALS